MRLDAYPGRYAIAGTRLATLSPPPDDPERLDKVARGAVSVGDTRSLQQDVSFGLRQMADVALKALSPGINDPTTAQDAIFHCAAVLAELLRRDAPPRVRTGDDGRRLVVSRQPTHDELIRLAFAETRRAAADQPTVCIYLLEALALLREPLGRMGLGQRGGALEEEARMVLEGARAAHPIPRDLAAVQRAYDDRFAMRG